MPIGKLVSSTTEYNYTQNDIKRLIANDLGIDMEKIELDFDRKENALPGDAFASSYYYSIDVTIDHAKESEPVKRHAPGFIDTYLSK